LVAAPSAVRLAIVYGGAMSPEPDRSENYRRFRLLTAGYRSGDIAAVKAVLGWPEDFPNTPQPMELASGDWPLVSAINLSPLRFVRRLLELGADPNYEARDGFPSLMAAIDAPRSDVTRLLALLLRHGARTDQRGVNDWTPLHFAVARRNLEAVRLFLAHGADLHARTRIDDCSTPREDAEAAGFIEAVQAMAGR
jgi:ankyrin repeat protein